MKSAVLSEKPYVDLFGSLRYAARDKPQAAVGFVDKLQLQREFHFRNPARNKTA
jgi:hypothetical protein